MLSEGSRPRLIHSNGFCQTEYNRVLNGAQVKLSMDFATISGGWSSVSAVASIVVDEWTPMITLDRSVILSPKSGKDRSVREMSQPDAWSCDANVLTLLLSWSGWTNATTRERLLTRRSWVVIAVWSCQNFVVGSAA